MTTRKIEVHDLLRAFSDRTRLRILHLLLPGEMCVGDLVGALRLPQPVVSRHLARLRAASLVAVHKRGLWAFYGLAPATGRMHRTLLDELPRCREEIPGLAEDARRSDRIRATGGCCPPHVRDGAAVLVQVSDLRRNVSSRGAAKTHARRGRA